MSSTGTVDRKFKLHVSFAEADIEFVDNLLAELGGLDRFDLSVTPGGQDDAKDWVHRAGGLIEAADAVIYILSPASIELPTVAYEAERAAALSKRMVPVVAQPLGKADLPATLAGLRPLRMETQQLFASNLRQLLRLLDADAGWIRLHTELYLKARNWRDNAHDKAYLLSGTEVAAAKVWTFERSSKAPKPTDLHMEFIAASEAGPMAEPGGARRAQPPAVRQRARRKPKPVAPAPEAALGKTQEPVEPARAKAGLWKLRRKPKAAARTTTVDLEDPARRPEEVTGTPALNGHRDPPLAEPAPVPNAADKEVHVAGPAAAPPAGTGNIKTQPDNEATVIKPPEDEAEPESLPVKEPARAKPGLWKRKRKPKMPARKITVDLDKLAYVPEALKILRTSDGLLRPPPPAKPAAEPDVAAETAEYSGPAAAAPDDTVNRDARPDNEAAVIGPPEDAASDANDSPLKSAPRPRAAQTAHPVIIAQDELDGLLSSLMAEADSDRS